MDYSQQDVVEINRVIKTIEATWDDLEELNRMNPSLEFEVMNLSGDVLYATSDEIRKTKNEAIKDRDTILTVEHEGKVVGEVIFLNNMKEQMNHLKGRIVIVICIGVAMIAAVMIIYLWLLYFRILSPFYRLKQFSQHVARGDLEFPLKIEKSNYFGEFAESLDLMREELNIARENERKADESKKELVAQLSHDIKTPIACIKAITELMIALSKENKQSEQLRLILVKADQVDLLISNMFHATLEELQELKVEPMPLESLKLYELIHNSDYNGCVSMNVIPECIIVADQLRLQQVFDNVISNSYKYAGTKINIECEIKDDFLEIAIKDFGKGIEPDEISLIFMKFKRGRNAESKNGSGLGLYIADYLIKQMGGKITGYNVEDGFCIRISLLLDR